MFRYIATKMAYGIMMIVTVSILVFSMIYIMPGDPVDFLAGQNVSDERREQMRQELGLNDPLAVQYGRWAQKAIRLDFGTSIITKREVSQSLMNRIPVTLGISFAALVFQMLIGVPLGALAAYKKDGPIDRLLMVFSSFFQAVPNFWLSMILILIFGVSLKMLPISGYKTWKHLILPIISIGLGNVAGTIRMTKSDVLEAYQEHYVMTAYAKGLKKRQVVTRHVMRNSLILVMVMVFMSLPWLISGSVIMENIFGIPGVGIYLTDAIKKRDYVVVQACIMIIAAVTVVCNSLSDIVIATLDPRVRKEGGGIG